MPANGTELPAYHQNCITPEPLGYETMKYKVATTSTFHNMLLHIKRTVSDSELLCIIVELKLSSDSETGKFNSKILHMKAE